MDPVYDDTGHQSIHGELFLDGVAMTGEEGLSTIAKVRGDAGPSPESIFEVFFRSIRVPKANHHPFLNSPLDERDGSFQLRCQGDISDLPVADVLEPFQLFPSGRPDSVVGVSSPKAFFGGDIRPLKVKPGAHPAEKRILSQTPARIFS